MSAYKGYAIQPKLDFHGKGYLVNGKWVNRGYIVTDGICNVLPGATWAQTIYEARGLVDDLIASAGDPSIFWKRVRARHHE